MPPSFTFSRNVFDFKFVKKRNLLLLFILDFEGSRFRPLNILER